MSTMEIFVTVLVILAMTALGVLLIRLLNSQHGDRSGAVHYTRSGTPLAGPAPSAPRRASGRAGRAGRKPSGAPAAAIVPGPADAVETHPRHPHDRAG
ncbi:hypothetical protein [Streptomyces djakartensis]|uniref:hypothetical protein n=1 Tax=Streptomyces djakartensis TaxID=68193 RepID=UPI003F7D531C